MNRREFLKTSLAAMLAAGLPIAYSGCSGIELAERKPGQKRLESLLRADVRVMWVAAHPDDESQLGALLAKSSLVYDNPCYLLVLTHGEGGECCLENGCKPDLPTIRAREMAKIAKLYKAQLQHERYFNAPLPVSSFPDRREIAEIWDKEKPVTPVIAKAIRRFKPDLLFTLAPIHGFTGHPEHQAASRFATAAIRMAADEDERLGGLAAHRVAATYYGLNHYFPMRLFGQADPFAVTDVFDARQLAINGWECREVMARFTKAHKTQDNDMQTVRTLSRLMKYLFFHRTDPFEEIYSPYEPVSA